MSHELTDPAGELFAMIFVYEKLSQHKIERFYEVALSRHQHAKVLVEYVTNAKGLPISAIENILQEPTRYKQAEIPSRSLVCFLRSEDHLLLDARIDIGINLPELDIPLSICGLTDIGTAAMYADYPGMEIVNEAFVFDAPGYERLAEQVGIRLYKLFLDICARTNPVYAGIVIEDDIPVLRKLVEARCGAFFDFFVNLDMINIDAKQLLAVYEGAYFEFLPNGLYISTFGYFNPKHITVPHTKAVAMCQECISEYLVPHVSKIIEKRGRASVYL